MTRNLGIKKNIFNTLNEDECKYYTLHVLRWSNFFGFCTTRDTMNLLRQLFKCKIKMLSFEFCYMSHYKH